AQIREGVVVRARKAYPVYDEGFAEAVRTVSDYVTTFGKADAGAATVTRPAPIRAAARAASRPAPVITAPPAISAWPRVYLWLSGPGQGNPSPHHAGSLATICGETRSSTASPMPIAATRISPQ